MLINDWDGNTERFEIWYRFIISAVLNFWKSFFPVQEQTAVVVIYIQGGETGRNAGEMRSWGPKKIPLRIQNIDTSRSEL